ncbi:MAG: GHKL domain-containing protein [Lachnospiraceae bacterium]|nr:GHKL domain-containing protein [Lachnospiraceae bacterium]
MLLLRDLSMLWSLLHILVLFMMLYRSRYSRKKTILLTGISMGFLILLNMTGLVLYGAEVMGKVFILTCTLPSLLVFWFISKDRNGRFFFTFCLADTVALWVITVTKLADYYFGGGQYILMFIGRLVMFPLLEYVAVRYIRKPYMELQEAVPNGWEIFAGMTALYYILLAIMGNFPVMITNRQQELPAFFLVLVLMPMTYATILTSLYRQLLLYQRKQAERLLQEQKNTLETQLESQCSIRRMKHDMKGHTITLAGLLAAGQIREAQTYLIGMQEEMDTLLGQYCANPYINAVFVHYARKFEEMGAACSTDIQIGEEALPHMELCQILSNELENACDAMRQLDAGMREVSVQIKYNKVYLLMRIKNRCRSDLYVERGTIPSTDKQGHEHGFGLITIKEAAEKLGGNMVCYAEHGSFVMEVMIPCKSFREKEAGGA